MIVRRTMSSKLILYLYPLIGLHIWATWSPMSFLDYLVGWSDTDKRLVSEKLLPSFRMVFRWLLCRRISFVLRIHWNLLVRYDSFISGSRHSQWPTPSRHLNNPEAMGGAAYFGLALIIGSKLVLSFAVLIRHLANWWFLKSRVQLVTPFYSYTCRTSILTSELAPFCSPHLRKLCGDSLRKRQDSLRQWKSG